MLAAGADLASGVAAVRACAGSRERRATLARRRRRRRRRAKGCELQGGTLIGGRRGCSVAAAGLLRARAQGAAALVAQASVIPRAALVAHGRPRAAKRCCPRTTGRLAVMCAFRCLCCWRRLGNDDLRWRWWPCCSCCWTSVGLGVATADGRGACYVVCAPRATGTFTGFGVD